MDEAHGARSGFHPYFPESALGQGADVVIHSLHKTLPAPARRSPPRGGGPLQIGTESSAIWTCSSPAAPAYVLMAGMDSHSAGGAEGGALWPLCGAAKRLRERLRIWKSSPLYRQSATTSSWSGQMTGRELSAASRDYHLQLEMAAGSYALAMTSVGKSRRASAGWETPWRRLTDPRRREGGECPARPAACRGMR